MDFNDVETLGDLVRNPWDVGILFTLRSKGSLRYTELGAELTAWSGRRPSDSALTRSLKRLDHHGLVTIDEDGSDRPRYMITPPGTRRVDQLGRVIGALHRTSARPSTQRTVPAAHVTMAPRQRSAASCPDSASAAVAQRPMSQPVTILPDSTTPGATAQTSLRSGQDRESNVVAPTGIDTSKAHPARRYDYWLGGKDNFAADRAAGDAIAAAFPTVRLACLENRAFLKRAVEFVVRDCGIRQILDIGTGIPTSPNTHEIAQAIDPSSKVVYVDNDPIVLTHARALLVSASPGSTAYIDADVRSPDRILNDPQLRQTLDFREPIALMMIAVLHFIPDAELPVRQLVQALPTGSYVAVTHVATDLVNPEVAAKLEAASQGSGIDTYGRDRSQVAGFFQGLELIEPGVVPITEWRDERSEPRPDPYDIGIWGAVGRLL
ncbi:SAM-dependent methyltransferase [Dactylosporangium sp. CA-139114]|uniref:SAM-dependent methyltransferase n=1 Tax=Dactylosporangium sp. CA-139114 TaxID=3239931 RepID=UPI003D99377A